MNPKEFTLKLEDRLEGAIGERGKFTGYLPNGKKGQLTNTNILTLKIILPVLNTMDYHQ